MSWAILARTSSPIIARNGEIVISPIGNNLRQYHIKVLSQFSQDLYGFTTNYLIMREKNVSFHRLEEFGSPSSSPETVPGEVICSFSTKRFGYFQLGYSERRRVFELKQEPDLNVFPEVDRQYMKCVVGIVWRMVFGVVRRF